jgi:hypothetical protein
MTPLPPGLYESLVTDSLAARLESLPDDRRAQTDGLRTAEAPDRIAWHIASVVERAIDMLPESQRTTAGAALARIRAFEPLPQPRDTRYHDRPVSLYGGMVGGSRRRRGQGSDQRLVKRFGKRVFEWACADLHSFVDRAAAERAEAEKAEELRRRGWGVWFNARPLAERLGRDGKGQRE